MTTLHETAYPCLKPDPTPRELTELYTPTEEEKGLGGRDRQASLASHGAADTANSISCTKGDINPC